MLSIDKLSTWVRVNTKSGADKPDSDKKNGGAEDKKELLKNCGFITKPPRETRYYPLPTIFEPGVGSPQSRDPGAPGNKPNRFGEPGIKRRGHYHLRGRGQSDARFFSVMWDDLADVIMRMVEKPGFTGPVNTGNPSEMTVKELAEQVIKLTARLQDWYSVRFRQMIRCNAVRILHLHAVYWGGVRRLNWRRDYRKQSLTSVKC
ncbi:hypothetical protein CHS0354_027416 [Potamilus streckersoni]|uniref:Uncharacterized protein n=1 Tax=Potamilus streckersoni TaxID=2493646 RepID=A0AAE0VZR3_9BIVA|nr:hypothetical protein CHS0354_027416 [Potamilus streckersoni]